MKKTKISSYYYPYKKNQVYEAVTTNTGDGSLQYSPLSESPEDQKTPEKTEKGSLVATVTDRTPGESCAYELNAPKFDVSWKAVFAEVPNGETKLTITETYTFHKGAVIAYLLFLIYGKQKDQHLLYFKSIESRLAKLYPKPGVKKAKPFTKIWGRK